jgi:HEPN superfamily AbiU2-like protein
MQLKLKSADEFRCLMTALLNDLLDARFHFNLHQNLANVLDEYATEFAQSRTFWNLTFIAHMDAVLVRLCRAYDTYDHDVLNLQNLLETIQANLSIFAEPNFRQRLQGNPFLDSLAADFKPPDATQLQKDIAMVSTSDPLVQRLISMAPQLYCASERPVRIESDKSQFAISAALYGN